jgi:dCMP deaminase
MDLAKKLKWDQRWFQLVDLVASWSKDPSTQVGAVIIPDGGDCPVIGWNGFPRGVKDLPERYADRDTKYMMVTHAEANSILNAARNGVNLRGSTIYISHPPCNECSKLIVQSGIKKVIHRPLPDEIKERWGKLLKYSDLILSEGGVITEIYEIEKEETHTQS